MTNVLHYFDRRQQGLRKSLATKGQTNGNFDFLFDRLFARRCERLCYGINGGSVPLTCKYKKVSSGPTILAYGTAFGDICVVGTCCLSSIIRLQEWSAHKQALYDICWQPKGNKLFTASEDKTICYWESHGRKIRSFRGHSDSVRSVDVCQIQPSVFASGSRDGSICVWDERSFKNAPVVTITDAHCCSWSRNNVDKVMQEAHSHQSGTCVAFQDEILLCSGGVGDKFLKVWDLRKTYVNKGEQNISQHSFKYEANSCIEMAFDSSRKYLYASCTDSKIYKYDCHSYNSNPVAAYVGHQVRFHLPKFSLSHDDQYLLSGSGDNFAYIWNVGCADPIYCLEGHRDEVSSVSWHPNHNFELVTCSDKKTFIWRVHMGRENVNECSVGFPRRVAQKSASHHSYGFETQCETKSSSSISPQVNCSMTLRYSIPNVSVLSTSPQLNPNETTTHLVKSGNRHSTAVNSAADSRHVSPAALSQTLLCSSQQNICCSPSSQWLSASRFLFKNKQENRVMISLFREASKRSARNLLHSPQHKRVKHPSSPSPCTRTS